MTIRRAAKYGGSDLSNPVLLTRQEYVELIGHFVDEASYQTVLLRHEFILRRQRTGRGTPPTRREAGMNDEQLTRCDNCQVELFVSDLKTLVEVHHLGERLDAGAEVPAGECRECGAFAYLIRHTSSCYECGRRYTPTRKPRNDQRHFCPNCTEKGAPNKWAQRDWKARREGREAG